MKYIKCTIGIALLAMMAVCSAKAQTNNPATFFNSVESYLTSFNTNYTFNGVTFEAATGYKQLTGIGAVSVLDVQYDIKRFHVLATGDFTGIGSAFNSLEGGIGYDLINHYDTTLEANIYGGYDFNVNSAMVEPKIDIKKKMTPNTFTEIGISIPEWMNQRKANATPCYFIEGGFTF
jgi:hypothetical protein